MSSKKENNLTLVPRESRRKMTLWKAVVRLNHLKKNGNGLPNSNNKVQITKRTNNRKLDHSLKRTIETGDLRKTEILIREGANVNNPGVQTWTPLHIAAQLGYHKIAKLLIKNGARVNSALAGPKELNGPKVTGLTPLHLAALWNNLKCGKVLLQNGASVCPKTNAACDPIHMALCKDHDKMVALLLDYGADVNLRFENNFFKVFVKTMPSELWLDHNLPLLHVSILKKLKKMAKLLVERGADVNLKSSFGKTALMQAVEVNDAELVELLVEKGVDVNECDDFGQPALHFTMINANRKASMYSKEEDRFAEEKLKIVALLVRAGADVNAQFPIGEKNASVVHYMIKYGFDLGVLYLFSKTGLVIKGLDSEAAHFGRFFHEYLTPDIVNDSDYILNLKGRFLTIGKSLERVLGDGCRRLL